MLMSVNTTIHDMSLKCFDDDYAIVHFLYIASDKTKFRENNLESFMQMRIPSLGTTKDSQIRHTQAYVSELFTCLCTLCSNSCGTLDRSK